LEKQHDQRVLFLVLFLLLAAATGGLFYLQQNATKNSAPLETRVPQSRGIVRPDTDFGPYMASLQKRIKRGWFPPKNTESLRGKVLFKVHHDGAVSKLRMIRSTGLAAADLAMMKAVDNAAPFDALPAGAPADVDIEFSFDYNVFSGRDGNRDKVENAEPSAGRHGGTAAP
jgi:TonB family protein